MLPFIIQFTYTNINTFGDSYFFMINAEEYYKNLPQDTEYLDFNELARMGDELVYVNRPSKEPTEYFYFPQPQKKGNG